MATDSSTQPPEHHRQTSSSTNRTNRSSRSRRRKNGSQSSDADSQRKAELREQRRAQNSGIRVPSETIDGDASAMIGDELSADNVQTAAATAGRSSQQSSRSHGGGSRSRGGGSRGHSRPENKKKTGPAPKVGAVATTGRAYGAAPRRNQANNVTQSMVAGNNGLSQEEIDQLHPKEAMAMNVQTVEDFERDQKREKRRKQKIAEETKRLKKDIAASSNKENKLQHNGVVVAFAKPDLDDDSDSDSDDDKSDDSSGGGCKRTLLILGVLALLIGAGAAAYFLTRGSTGAKNTVDTYAPVVKSTPNPSKAPNRTSPPTVPPRTSGPSAFPSAIVVYEPPSEEDCAAILKGEKVKNQDNLPKIKFEIKLDVQFTEQNPDVQSSAATLQEQIQRRIVADLAGCELPDERRLVNDEGELREYAVASGKVLDVRPFPQGAEQCDEPPSSPTGICIPMKVLMDIILKGDEFFFKVTNFVREGFNEVLEELELGPAFGEIKFHTIKPRDEDPITTRPPFGTPTMVPSTTPTMAPAPTNPQEPSPPPTMVAPVPTNLPPPPTTAPEPPSSTPTQNPTKVIVEPTSNSPSKSPTESPSTSPSMSPTNTPTNAPSKNPTKSPTKRPTGSPTKKPTPPPTNRPSAPPTEEPIDDSTIGDNGIGADNDYVPGIDDDWCVADFAADTSNLVGFEYYDTTMHISDLVSCDGTNPIVAFTSDSSGCACIAKYEPGCNEWLVPIVLPGNYINQMIFIFEARDRSVADNCPESPALVLYDRNNCEDTAGFQDWQGLTCDDYTQTSQEPFLCFAEQDPTGLSADDACCHCGGGTYFPNN